MRACSMHMHVEVSRVMGGTRDSSNARGVRTSARVQKKSVSEEASCSGDGLYFECEDGGRGGAAGHQLCAPGRSSGRTTDVDTGQLVDVHLPHGRASIGSLEAARFVLT